MTISRPGRFEQVEIFLYAHTYAIGSLIAVIGLIWRLRHASHFYLNPDEAFHYWVATHSWRGWIEMSKRAGHTPLFFLAIRQITRFGNSEWLLRLVPIAAGALFPWFVMAWARRFSSNASALSAQLILTFSPTLIDLSSELRGYTLAFFFLSISLFLLESALDLGRKTHMAVSAVFLCLAILTEYCVAPFIVAMGLYTFWILLKEKRAPKLWIAWALAQVFIFAVCAFLFVALVWKGLPGKGTVDGWLRAEFLQPGQGVLAFALRGTVNQFKYLLGIHYLGAFAAIVFVFGVYRIWKSRGGALVMLMTLPLFLACAAAVFQLFPYGATRHTAVLGISLAVGIGSAIATCTRNRILPILLSALLIVPVWNRRAEERYLPIAAPRRDVELMRQATQFLRSSVPAGSVVVTDIGTYYMLAYFLDSGDHALPSLGDGHREVAGLQFVVAPTFRFVDDAALQQFLAQMRQGNYANQPIWVATGGFEIQITNPAATSAPFQKAVAIFEVLPPAR